MKASKKETNSSMIDQKAGGKKHSLSKTLHFNELTLLASSSALCLAVLETDLSDSNRARRNSIVIPVESSIAEFFLKTIK